MTLDSSFSLNAASASELTDAREGDALLSGKNRRINRSKPGSTSEDRLFFGPENALLQAFVIDPTQLLELSNFPICIYGPSGCGKSELAHYFVKTLSPEFEIHSHCASDFFQDFIEAIDLNELNNLRDRLTSPKSVLVLDSFEEFCTKPSIFEELIYQLDHCPRMIITSSYHPADLSGIPYRVTSRLLNGLSIPMENPSVAARILILKNEVNKFGGSISDEAADWLVNNQRSSIPEIKQIISKLRIQLDFSQTIELTAVQRVFKKKSKSVATLAEITAKVAQNQLLKPADLKSQSRKRPVVQARSLVVYIAREVFQYKYEEIGRYLGNRDHTTILHAHKKIKKELSADIELNNCVSEITKIIQQPKDA